MGRAGSGVRLGWTVGRRRPAVADGEEDRVSEGLQVPLGGQPAASVGVSGCLRIPKRSKPPAGGMGPVASKVWASAVIRVVEGAPAVVRITRIPPPRPIHDHQGARTAIKSTPRRGRGRGRRRRPRPRLAVRSAGSRAVARSPPVSHSGVNRASPTGATMCLLRHRSSNSLLHAGGNDAGIARVARGFVVRLTFSGRPVATAVSRHLKCDTGSLRIGRLPGGSL
jgi:hypothetical protein